METEESHYEVLGIAEEASAKEVKKAFFRKVREHPPEQDPEGHKRIREAYDVLSDPVSRKEYDNMSSYGEQINQLKREAEALIQQDPPATGEAIPKLKKAIVLGPEIGILRNQLGNCYLAEDEPDKALKQFEKALSINEKNESYRLSKGHALQAMGRLREAEHAFREVWEDDKGEYAAARGLANVLFDREHIGEAHEVLEEAIWADGKRDFEDFFCYYDKLHLYVAQGKTDKIEDTLDTVTEMTETLDDRRYAAFMLAQTADELYAVNAFSLAHRFAKTAKDLDDGSMEIDEQIDHLAELRELEDSLDAIMDSDRYHEIVQQMMAIYYDQATGAMSEDQAERAIENLVQGLENVMQADPDNTQIKNSLRRIRRRHPEAFELNKEFFELILDTPDADLFVDDCPHCEEPVMAEKGYSGQMYCPQCDGEVYSDGHSYSRRKDASPSSSSSSTQETQDESEGGIGFIIGVIVFLFFGAQMCA